MVEKKSLASLVVVLLVAYAINAYLTKPLKIRSPVIETKSGEIQGIVSVSRLGRKYHEFLGIPYAQPPVGNLRLEPPVPVTKWKGLRDVSEYGHPCAQLEQFSNKVVGNEDCLFLNVFVPETQGKLLPTMVWIHGGAFILGSSDEYNPIYFMDEDVVLVTVNYRLGALGFLSTGDGTVRGNMGLKDQSLALKWVNQNIQFFGGDPQQVTVFGESAGGASTSFHLLSPMSKGLFSKAIIHSGVSLAPWAVHKRPEKRAETFTKEVGCLLENKKAMVDCLKGLSAHDFVKGHKEVRSPMEPYHIFSPTIESIKDENTFISEDPLDILKSGKVNVVPLIIGANSHEGLLNTAITGANQSRLDEANNDFPHWADTYLNLVPKEMEKLDEIRKFYFNNAANIASIDLIQNYTNLLSDRHFFVPSHQFVQHYSKDVPVHLYYFSYQGESSLAPILAATEKHNLPVIVNILLDMATRWVKTNVFGMTIEHMGTCHGDEIPYFFKYPLFNEISSSSADFTISRELVSLWAAFASNAQSLTFRGQKWTPTKQQQLKYLKIDSVSAMIDEPFADRVKFWESLLS